MLVQFLPKRKIMDCVCQDVALLSRGLEQGTVLQTAIGAAYIRARLHAVSAYPVIDRSHTLAVAFSKRFFPISCSLADAFPNFISLAVSTSTHRVLRFFLGDFPWGGKGGLVEKNLFPVGEIFFFGWRNENGKNTGHYKGNHVCFWTFVTRLKIRYGRHNTA